jgi:hypothetical protein
MFIAIAMCVSVCANAFEARPWIADFEQLKAAMSANYPNLEWAAARGMDLAAAKTARASGLPRRGMTRRRGSRSSDSSAGSGTVTFR